MLFGGKCIGRRDGWREGGTNDTRLTAVVYIHQVAVQVHVLISPFLHGCIRRLFGLGAWREGEFGVEGIGRKVD
jgi:hypothetical protein